MNPTKWFRLVQLSLLVILGMFAGAGPKANGTGGVIGGSTIQTDIWGPIKGRYVTFQDTAATAHQLQKNGMHLVRIQLTGGAHVGSLIFNYATNKFAHFPVSNLGEADYDLDFVITGSSVPAASWTTDGTAPTQWTLTFAETSWGGPSIENFLAIRVSVVAGGAAAVLTNIAVVNFDAGEAVPTAVAAYVSHAGVPAAVYFPGEPGLQGGANAQDENFTFPAPITPAPEVKPANGIIMAYTAAAACTVTAYVFYRPTAK